MRRIALAGGVVVLARLLSGEAGAAAGEVLPQIAANQAASSDTGGATRISSCGAYVAIDGSAKIVRVDETAASRAQAAVAGGPGHAGYEVWFSFTPDELVSDTETAAWIVKEHELRLANSWYPGPAFIKKYGLEAGNTIPATLQVQTSGPCAPFVVDFPTVDTTDYFESAR